MSIYILKYFEIQIFITLMNNIISQN